MITKVAKEMRTKEAVAVATKVVELAAVVEKKVCFPFEMKMTGVLIPNWPSEINSKVVT